jgi:hypothetical protein
LQKLSNFEDIQGLARAAMSCSDRGCIRFVPEAVRLHHVMIKRVGLVDPPSVNGHEISEKGYINQRATLERREGLVDKLYAGGEGVIKIPTG